MRGLVEWIVLTSVGVVAGLGVAWIESGFAIPRSLISQALVVALVMAAGYAMWTAYGYYGNLRDDDHWD